MSRLAEAQGRTVRRVCVASAPPGPGTADDGIYLFASDAWTAQESFTPCAGAQFIVLHPNGRFLYAVQALEGEGRISAFLIASDGKLQLLGTESSGGALPCHLAVDPLGRQLYCANYGDGSISVHAMGQDGQLCPEFQTLPAEDPSTGTVPERQERPHAHCAVPDHAGRFLLSADLGTDRISTYRTNTLSLSKRTSFLQLPEGAGPRHLAFNADGYVLVSCELNSTVVACRFQALTGQLQFLGSLDATAREPTSANFPAHVASDMSGRFFYVSNRGADTLSSFEITPTGPRLLAEMSSGGSCPRHFALADDRIYVANQGSDRISIIPLDAETGQLGPAGLLVEGIPRPACVAIF